MSTVSLPQRQPSVSGSPMVISTPSPPVIPAAFPSSNNMMISNPQSRPVTPNIPSFAISRQNNLSQQDTPMSLDQTGQMYQVSQLSSDNQSVLISSQGIPSSSKLTIYSRSGHIVQKFPQGTRLITLPKSVEIASIVAVDADGVIIPFSYVPETSMGIALTDRSTGEKVQAMVLKEGETINGKILSLDSDNVMLMTGNQITNIREYDRVTVGINEDLTRPRLVLERDTRPFTLSYLLSSIAWTCVGTALIDNVKNIMYLRLAGNISNSTESDIRAHTILVSGEVYQYRGKQDAYAESQVYPSPRALMATSTPIRSPKVQSSMLEDYVKYEVGDRLVRNQDIAELGTWQIPIIKLYLHQTSASGALQDRNDNDIVRFGYRFLAPGYIPSCSLNVYSIDSNKEIDAYLGSNEIDESQNTDEVDIMLGESTMLQCKSLVVISNDVVIEDEDSMRKYKLPMNGFKSESNNQGYQQQQQQFVKGKYIDERRWHVITEDLKVEITNHNYRPVSLVLKHFVGNKYLIQTRCQAYKDRKNGFIEWYFEVPPRTSPEPRKEKFACQILTASYY